jgi:hypothetical protein
MHFLQRLIGQNLFGQFHTAWTYGSRISRGR